MTRKSDVRLLKGWLLDADEVASEATSVPEGWEHGLLLALAPEGQPFYFFMTLVEPDAEHDRPRYFAGWVHAAVLLDDRKWSPGNNGELHPYAGLAEARAGLTRAFVQLTRGSVADFAEEWRSANAVLKDMRRQREL